MISLTSTPAFVVLGEIRRMFPDWDNEGLLGMLQLAQEGDFVDTTILNVAAIVTNLRGDYDELIQELEGRLL